jgi:acyl dehydratase
LKYLEDFVKGQRHFLGTFTLSAAGIMRFAEDFDPQPYHLSEREGSASLFGGLVASGWHTAASFMRLYVDTVLKDSAAQGSPGVDQLRWLHPVRPDEKLSATLAVAGRSSVLTRPDCGTVHNHCELARSDGELMMTMTLYAMFLKRPATT